LKGVEGEKIEAGRMKDRDTRWYWHWGNSFQLSFPLL